MQLIPGNGGAGLALPFVPQTRAAQRVGQEAVNLVSPQPLESAPPPPPSAEIADIQSARKTAQEEERRRRGRRSSILTSSRGVGEELGSVNRPQAARLFGG